MKEEQDSNLITIKKYKNRRLYNTESSQYVTLEDLFQMVQNGKNFQVLDSTNNEDITRSILTQIIFEQESKGYELLPISFLRQIISLYGDKGSNVFAQYLSTITNNFTNNKEHFEKLYNDFEYQNPVESYQEFANKNIKMFEDALSYFSSANNQNND